MGRGKPAAAAAWVTVASVIGANLSITVWSRPAKQINGELQGDVHAGQTAPDINVLPSLARVLSVRLDCLRRNTAR